MRFLKLGTFGFGGPIAMLGIIEQDLIRGQQWVSLPEYQRMVAVAKLFPGPLATLVSIRLGLARAGFWGGMLAGFGLILPAFLMILALAQVVATVDHVPLLQPFWIGLSLAAIAASIQAAVKLTKPLFSTAQGQAATLHSTSLLMVIVLNAILTFAFPQFEVAFIALSAFGVYFKLREAASLAILLSLFLTCGRASLFTFGSGLAIVPVLRTFFIDQHHWISAQDFLRGLTLGQITPGPLIIIATYLGYLVAGFWGATVSTLGTFLPAFVFGLWLMPKFESRLLQSPTLKTFFQGLMPAVCGAIFGAVAKLLLFSIFLNGEWYWGRALLTSGLTWVAIRFQMNVLWLFALGGLLAYSLA